MDIEKIIRKLYKVIIYLFPIETQARIAGVNIGKNNFIASKFWSSEPYLISIGSNCQITDGVKIFTHGGGNAIREKNPKFDCFGKVNIGDFVYIGNNSLIMPGVTIENNVLIGAGSVVTKSIPPNVIVAGNPAKILCTLDDWYNKNLNYDLGTKGLSYEAKRKILQKTDKSKFIKKQYMQTPNKKE